MFARLPGGSQQDHGVRQTSSDAPDPGKAVRAAAARGTTLLVGSIALTVVTLRLALHASPDSDFDVFGYNVHHLFTGLVLITVGGVPLAILRHRSRLLDAATIVFGAGLGMALDEWVYLIATDGSNASYLLPVSLYGSIVAVALACTYAVGVALIGRRGKGR